MNPNIILREPSFMISKMEGDMKLIDMCKSINITYSYAQEIKNKLLGLGIIKLSDIRLYELTDKGKEIQEHLRIIVRGLK